MSRPGFYNDNEYRAYPFIYNSAADTIPTNVIVDAGFIMGLDAYYDEKTDYIWLERVQRICVTGRTDFKFVFRATGVSQPIIFGRAAPNVGTPPTIEWATEYAESVDDAASCGTDPIWSGFMVTGRLTELAANMVEQFGAPNTDSGAVTHELVFANNAYRVEPGRVQNLRKAYLRSVSVGNYRRVTVPVCDNSGVSVLPNKTVIVNKECMSGDLLFREGYNCQIIQKTRNNSINIGAVKGGGTAEDSALCENSGEIPFTPNEEKPLEVAAANGKPEVRSKFLSGGPACKDLIFTINGIGGSNVNLIGGVNFSMRGPDEGETATLHLNMNQNIQGGCDGN